MNKGILGCINLNKEIQKSFQNNRDKSRPLSNGSYEFYIKDRVIQLSNNYDLGVFNGDIGYISKIDYQEKTLCIDFGSNSVIYEKDQLSNLALAYAITIHKSQGSEFPVVFIPLVCEHTHMLNRNLVYTALTRAKQIAVLMGSKKTLLHAIKKHETVKRQSLLKERLMGK